MLVSVPARLDSINPLRLVSLHAQRSKTAERYVSCSCSQPKSRLRGVPYRYTLLWSGLRRCNIVRTSTSASIPPRNAFAVGAQPPASALAGLPTLHEFVSSESEAGRTSISGQDAVDLLGALEQATKVLADKISRASIENLTGMYDGTGRVTAAGDKQKKLDVLANEVLKERLIATRKVAVLASEEEDEVVILGAQGSYAVVFDPLDGSRNIDAGIPTGTILGVYQLPAGVSNSNLTREEALSAVLQPGHKLVMAAYSLYSSATTIFFTLGHGTHGCTLDSRTGEFLLTHKQVRIPARGQIYSLNDARYFDWPKGLQRYIDTIRQGRGRYPKQYSARYICCLVADFHRTLLYGGWAANPRAHLRLVYEANPLSFLCEQAGGRGSDGRQRLLSISPSKLHQKLPVFLGSPEDIEELESYDDIQQVSGTYEV